TRASTACCGVSVATRATSSGAAPNPARSSRCAARSAFHSLAAIGERLPAQSAGAAATVATTRTAIARVLRIGPPDVAPIIRASADAQQWPCVVPDLAHDVACRHRFRQRRRLAGPHLHAVVIAGGGA